MCPSVQRGSIHRSGAVTGSSEARTEKRCNSRFSLAADGFDPLTRAETSLWQTVTAILNEVSFTEQPLESPSSRRPSPGAVNAMTTFFQPAYERNGVDFLYCHRHSIERT